MRQIIWTRPAEEDLRAIFDFLTDELGLSDDHGLSIIDRILDKTATLSSGFPSIGQKEPLLESFPQQYRYLLEGNYKVIYSYQKELDIIYIHMVFDTRQNPRTLEDRFGK